MKHLDWFWWTPQIIGSVGIVFSALWVFKHHIKDLSVVWEFIFGTALVMIVVIEGVNWFGKSLDELVGEKE